MNHKFHIILDKEILMVECVRPLPHVYFFVNVVAEAFPT
jgi:hypothetical protein